MEVQDEMGRLEKVRFFGVLDELRFLMKDDHPFSLSKNMKEVTSRNQIGWTNLRFGKWRRYML